MFGTAYGIGGDYAAGGSTRQFDHAGESEPEHGGEHELGVIPGFGPVSVAGLLCPGGAVGTERDDAEHGVFGAV